MVREKHHTTEGALGEGEANRDRLLAYLATSDFALDITQKIQSDGYAVIPNVLSPEECDAELDRMWRFVQTIEPSIKRHNPATWQDKRHLASIEAGVKWVLHKVEGESKPNPELSAELEKKAKADSGK